MGAIADAINLAIRDFVAGVSGARHSPDKADVRDIGELIDSGLAYSLEAFAPNKILGGDNAAVLGSAIDACLGDNIGTLVFPPGRYRFQTALQRRIPQGLRFVTMGKKPTVAGLLSDDQAYIQWTGSGYLFDFREPDGTDEVGGMAWKGFTFDAQHDAGGIFSLNYLDEGGVDYVPDDTAGTPNYVRQIRFSNCFANGSRGGALQTGDFIRAKKAFEISVNRGCEVRNFRRAVHLNGCDNAMIGGRYQGNTRHIMNVNNGTFGNDNVLCPRFLGGSNAGGDGGGDSEGRYPIYDSGRCTTIGPHTAFEDIDGLANMYLNGNAVVYNPKLGAAGQPIWRVGPQAKGTSIIRPFSIGAAFTSLDRPVYDMPETMELSAAGYMVEIFQPSWEIRGLLIPHPRQRITPGELNQSYEAWYPAATSSIDANGVRQQDRYEIHALNYGGQLGGYGAPTLIQEAGAPFRGDFNGWAIKFAEDAGMLKRYVCGQHFKNGDRVKVTLSFRSSAAGAVLRFSLNNSGGSILTIDTAHSATYARATNSVVLTGFADGDPILCYFINQSPGTQDVFLGWATIEVCAPAIADISTVAGDMSNAERIKFNDALAAMRLGRPIAD